ncbi:unannotated protein [freshwater metagenome]|uniref:Unannotated protein n=1 Tax=freshwater metagenome TaxID=449393 RepID=A0A6J6MBS0_9ZZZZ
MLIGLSASVSSGFAFTANTPKIDAITPIARAASGNTSPIAGLRPIELNAATPRMMEATSVTSYDSKRSAAIPAQSPTLSPTLSAIVAGLRGSSSGIPASTFPTRSAPTSAAFVKIPPPTRKNNARSDPPKPNPTRMTLDVFWKIMMIAVAPLSPRPTVNIPATPPVRNATVRASGIEPVRAAAAVRTFPRVANVIPM